MSFEILDDAIETAPMGPGAFIIGGKTLTDLDPTNFGRDSVLATVRAGLAPLASSGSASDLSSGTVPLGRLHAYLRDISNIQAPATGDVLIFNGSVFVNGTLSNGLIATALVRSNNLSDVDDAATSRTNIGLGTGDTPEFAGIVLGSGSASTPSLRHSADLNTGIYFPANDRVSIATSGIQRIEFSPTGTVGVNVAAQPNSGAIFRIDNPPEDGANATRLTIANTAGHRAVCSLSSAFDHISMAMGYQDTDFLEDRWGIGMSGIPFYPLVIEHGYSNATDNPGFGLVRPVRNVYHGNVGIHTGTTSLITTATHKLTVGQSPYDSLGALRVGKTDTIATGTIIGVYKDGGALAAFRDTTNNTEAIFGASSVGAIVGTSSAHSLIFRVAAADLMQFDGATLGPVNTGTVALGSTLLHWGNHYSQGKQVEKEVALTLANGTNSDVVLPAGAWLAVSAPSGAFTITGFAGPENGRRITVYNATAQNMTIVNDATSTAANRILTLTGADVVLTGTSAARFQYSAASSRWILLGTQG